MKDKKLYAEQPLTDAIFKLMRSLRRRPEGGIRVSRGYFRLLGHISGREGLSSSELAELMDIRPSSLTELLNRMEADGLVRRQRDEKDQRVVRIYLGDAGKGWLERDGALRARDALSDILTEEESETFIALCEKLSAGLEKRLPEADGGRAHHAAHMGGKAVFDRGDAPRGAGRRGRADCDQRGGGREGRGRGERGAEDRPRGGPEDVRRRPEGRWKEEGPREG